MNNKNQSIQALRGAGFLLVFLHHTVPCNTGHMGVSLFLVLSGFLLSVRHINESLPGGVFYDIKYALKKIKKLYVLHIIMLIIRLPLEQIMGTYRGTGRNWLIEFLANVLLIQSWVPNQNIYSSFNIVSWYLSTILFLYALFPIILRRIKKINAVNKCIQNIVIVFLIQLTVGVLVEYFVSKNIFVSGSGTDYVVWFTYIFPLYRLGDFVIGCNLGVFYLLCKRNVNNKVVMLMYGIAGTGLLVVMGLNYYNVISDGWKESVVYIPFTCLLVLATMYGKDIFSQLWTNRLLVYIGDISAYAYMIHVNIRDYMKCGVSLCGKEYMWQYWVIPILLLTIVISEAYRKMERNVLKKKIVK